MAGQTDGFSEADLAGVWSEAASSALGQEDGTITAGEIKRAVDRVRRMVELRSAAQAQDA